MKKTKCFIKTKVLGAVAIAAAFFIGAMPMTAYAGGVECTCEHKCTEDHVNEECELCKTNPDLCCGDENEDPVTEEPSEEPKEEIEEKYGPLTPDGNMTLVDDYGSPKSGKQFITVVTKSGNYFYIIIDRDDNGNETVHFLNMVDEADLLALMDDEDVEAYMAAKGAGAVPTETSVETPTEVTEEPEEPVEEPKPKKKSNGGVIAVILLLVLGGAGGYVYFTKFKGAKKPQNEYTDPDADYNEDEDNLLDSLPDDVDDLIIDVDEINDSYDTAEDFESANEED